MHGRDGRVGAVAFGFRGNAKDEQCPEQRSDPDDQRQGPRPGERHRRRVAALAGWSGHLIAGQYSRGRSGCWRRGFVEDDGPDARHRTDEHAEDDPFLQIGGARRASGKPALCRPPRRSAEDAPEDRCGQGSSRFPSRCANPGRGFHQRPRPAASPRPWSLHLLRDRGQQSAISARRRSVTMVTRCRTRLCEASRTCRRSLPSVRRCTRRLRTSRSTIRDAVGASRTMPRPRRQPWGPREARTTSVRYWVRVTSSPTSASDRAAIATIARLAVRTASSTGPSAATGEVKSDSPGNSCIG